MVTEIFFSSSFSGISQKKWKYQLKSIFCFYLLFVYLLLNIIIFIGTFSKKALSAKSQNSGFLDFTSPFFDVNYSKYFMFPEFRKFRVKSNNARQNTEENLVLLRFCRKNSYYLKLLLRLPWQLNKNIFKLEVKKFPKLLEYIYIFTFIFKNFENNKKKKKHEKDPGCERASESFVYFWQLDWKIFNYLL